MKSWHILNLALSVAEPDLAMTLLSSAKDLLFGNYSKSQKQGADILITLRWALVRNDSLDNAQGSIAKGHNNMRTKCAELDIPIRNAFETAQMQVTLVIFVDISCMSSFMIVFTDLSSRC